MAPAAQGVVMAAATGAFPKGRRRASSASWKSRLLTTDRQPGSRVSRDDTLFYLSIQAAEAGAGQQPAATFAVLGGGIVGTFCAGLLARRGFHVELLESAEPSQTTWRGIINMTAQAVQLLQEADPALLRAVLAEHKQSVNSTIWDSGMTTEIFTYDIATESQRCD